MGRIQDLEGEKEAMAKATKPATRAGAEWIPIDEESSNEARPSERQRHSADVASAVTVTATNESTSLPKPRSADEFVSAKKRGGSAPPVVVTEIKPRDNSQAAGNSTAPNTPSPVNSTDPDPYAHLHPHAWRDAQRQQQNHRDHRSDHTDDYQISPIAPDEIAYEVVATAVFDNDDDDDDDGKNRRNPFRDWRVLALIVVVAAVVGVAVGLVTTQNTSGSAAVAATADTTGTTNTEQNQQQPGQDLFDPGTSGSDSTDTPSDVVTPPPEADEEDIVVDEVGNEVEEELESVVIEEPGELEPIPAPPQPPAEGTESEPEPESVAKEEREDDTTSTTPPTTTSTTVGAGDDPNDQPLPLAGCSASDPDRPAVLLNTFSIYLSTTLDDAPNQIPSDDFVQVTFAHLWTNLKAINGVMGYSLGYDLVQRRRRLRVEVDENRQAHDAMQPIQQPTSKTNLRHSSNNINMDHQRRRRRLMGGSFNAILEGCIDLRDGTAVPPSYNDVQAAIETAFSGTSLDSWLTKANAAGVAATSVSVLDGNGLEIGTAVP